MTAVEGSTSHSPITFDEHTPIFVDSLDIDYLQAAHIEHTQDNASETPNSIMPRSAHISTLSSRTSRPRISTNRARPYHDVSSRPGAPRKSSTPCKYFQSGKCFAGATCRYQHVLVSSTHATEELDRQLLAFVTDDGSIPPNVDEIVQLSPEEPSPSSALTPSGPVCEGDVLEHELSDNEELYEIVPHPETCVAEVRYYSTLHPDQSRTYFVAQRQAVVGYEGNNVGVLSGGVLLGIPCAAQQSDAMAKTTGEDVSESEATGSSSPSSVSQGSGAGIWKGPVWFDDGFAADHLDWADDEYVQTPMEGVEPTFSSATLQDLPTPPPVIRRIIRSVEGHNRRHSLA